MSLPIHVEAYSGYKARERHRQFVLDEQIYEITAVLDQWYEPTAMTSKCRPWKARHICSATMAELKTTGRMTEAQKGSLSREMSDKVEQVEELNARSRKYNLPRPSAPER
jgi:hypothetical protein